jgi:hypothetical protein
MNGNRPLMMKTANIRPQLKNHFFALADIDERTSALMTALSKLVITSNKQRPNMMIMVSKIAMIFGKRAS